jgi:hypothetical protein
VVRETRTLCASRDQIGDVLAVNQKIRRAQLATGGCRRLREIAYAAAAGAR